MSQTKTELVNGLSINAAAADTITVDSTGRVGINDSSPSKTLDITGESGGNGEINVKRTSGATCFIQAQSATAVFGSSSNHNTQLKSNGVTALTIDTSQKIGIGTSSPAVNLDVSAGSGTTQIYVRNTATSGQAALGVEGKNSSGTVRTMLVKYDNNDSFRFATAQAVPLTFSTSDTVRLTVAADGKINFGSDARVEADGVFKAAHGDAATPSYNFLNDNDNGMFRVTTNTIGFSTAGTKRFQIDASGNKFLDVTFDTTANNARKSYFTSTGQQFHGRNAHEAYIVFQDVSNNNIGNITRGAGASIAFNTSSDYRLKENVVDLTDAITRLKTLKPKRFNFKSEPSITMDGFLAHEVTAVPEAVEGEKDGIITQEMIDAGTLEGKVGDPIYQGIDQSKLVPLLVAAVKELITKVETLEAA